MNVKCTLAAIECLACQGVDLFDQRICHRVATRGPAIAMNHERSTSVAIHAVIGIRVAEIERQVELAVRVHLARIDGVETFRRLFVTFLHFRPKPTGPVADRIGLEVIEAAIILLFPDFELRLLLENPDENRGFLSHALFGEQHLRFGRQGFHGCRNIDAASGKTSRKHQRRHANHSQLDRRDSRHTAYAPRSVRSRQPEITQPKLMSGSV